MSTFTAAEAQVRILPSLAGFKKRLDAELKAVPASKDVTITADTSQFLREVEAAKAAAGRGKVTIEVDDRGSIGSYRRKVAAMRNDLYLFDSVAKSVGTLQIKVVGIALLPQLAVAAASATKSVQDLSGALALLPAGLSALGGVMGTLLTGVSGVSDAFKAFSDATADSASDMRKANDAARSLRDANRDLANAVKDARRSLQDLNAELRDAPLNEADAILDLREAQQEAADFRGKDALDRQRDALNVEKAESNLANTRVRNSRIAEDAAEANAKGVANADQVVSALDRLANAQEGSANSVDKITAAMGRLSPNAQDFVTKVRGMGQEWQRVKFTVQDNLFAGLGDEVIKLGQNLPLVEKGLGGIATALNSNVKTAFSAIGTGQNKGFLERIFGNTAEAQKLLDRAIEPLINAFLRLSAVGSDFLPRLANGIGNLAERFDEFLKKADEDGSLKQFINNGIEAWKSFGNILLDALSIVHSITEAFGASGGKGLLGTLEDGAEKLSTFLKSAEGKQSLIKFFQDARNDLAEWKGTLGNVVEGVRGVVSAIKEWAEFVRPFFSFMANALGEHPTLAKAVVTAYLAFRTIPPILAPITAAHGTWTKRIGGVQGAAEKLSKFIGTGGALLTAVTGLTSYMGMQFVQGMDAGASALERQKLEANDLRDALDEVTGAATGASQALVIGKLQNATNTATGEEYGNLLPELEKRGVDTQALTAAAASGDTAKVEALLAPIKGASAQDVAQTEFWKDNQKSLQDAGLSPETVARAINGDREAIKRFEDWAYGRASQDALGVTDRRTLDGLSNAGVVTLPDLLDVKQQLPQDAQTGANILGTTNSLTQGTVTGQQQIGEANRTQYGSLSLNPGNPFGPGATARGNPNGASVLIPRVLSPDDPLWKNIEANGGTVTPLLNSTRVDLRPDRAKLYIPEFASGGLFRGKGTSTSDSNVIRASDGEFINRAASVRKYGTGLFDALNAGAIPPQMLPRFDQGGQVLPWLPPPIPGAPGNNPLLAGPKAGFTGQQIPGASAQIPGSFLGDAPRVADLWHTPGTGLPGSAWQPQESGLPGPLGQLPKPPAGPSPTLASPGGGFRSGAVGDADRQILEGSGIDLGGYGGRGTVETNPQPGTGLTVNPDGSLSRSTGSTDHGGSTQHIPGTTPGPGGGSASGVPSLANPNAVPFGITQPPPNTGIQPGPLGGLPENLQPLNIGQQIGAILLDMIFGFFGIDAGPIKQALGLIPQLVSAVGGGPTVQGIIEGAQSAGIVPESGQPAVNTGTTGTPIAALPEDLQQLVSNPESMAAAFGGNKTTYTPDLLEGLPKLYDPAQAKSGTSEGLPQWITDLAGRFGLNAVTRPDGDSLHEAGFAVDIFDPENPNGPSANKDAMAQFIKDHLKGQSLQLIYEGTGGTKFGIAGAADVGPGTDAPNYYSSSWAGHRDHLHWATDVAPILQQVQQRGLPNAAQAATGSGGVPLVQRADGTWTSPNPAWAHLIQRESGGRNIGQQITDANSGPGSPNAAQGLFQITPATWRGAGGEEFAPNPLAATPEEQAIIAARIFQNNPSGSDWGAGLDGRENAAELLAGLNGLARGGSPGGMPIRISNGEYRTNPDSVQKYGVGLFNALNAGAVDPKSLPGFAHGGIIPPLSPEITDMGGGNGPNLVLEVQNGNIGARAGQPIDPRSSEQMRRASTLPGFAEGGWFGDLVKPNNYGQSSGQLSRPQNNVGQRAGQGLGPPKKLGNAAGHRLNVKGGAEGPAGSQRKKDPRSVLGAPPTNHNHNLPAVDKGIQGVGNAIGTAASTALSIAAAAGAGAGAGPGAGIGASMAGSLIGNAVQVGTQTAQGVANIFSSLMVGTLTPGTTEGAYGTPLLPTPNQTNNVGPRVQNNYGDIHVGSYEQFHQGQQRVEAQQAASFMPPLG